MNATTVRTTNDGILGEVKPNEGKKPYRPPTTLAEYGSVAKLTMAKGNTRVENPTTKKQSFL